MKILVYTSMYYIGREKQNLSLVRELRSRGHYVIHATPTDQLKISNEPGFPKEFQIEND